MECDFLQPPTAEELAALGACKPQAQSERVSAEYANCSERFVLKERSYNRQYSHLYYVRLHQMRRTIEETARAKWGDLEPSRFLDSIKMLKQGEECVLFGTLYKDMKLKPSVLQEYMKGSSAQSALVSYVSASDFAVVEDQTARVQLCGEKLDVGKTVTGMIIAVRGREQENGTFKVDDYAFCGAPPAPPMASGGVSDGPCYVALVSGLRVGEAGSDPLPLQLLRDFLLGASGSPEERRLAGRVARLVIAGDALTAAKDAASVGAVEECDVLLAQLASSLPVDLMPGGGDPSNFSLPQQPVHPAFFREARRFASFASVTNPYCFSLNSTKLNGTSGQCVKDVLAFSTHTSPISALTTMVEARSLAPTAPDTLACYPYTAQDPFAISSAEQHPHVIFSANHPKLEVARTTAPNGTPGPLCVCVPDFSHDPTLVLLELSTLEVKTVSFGAPKQAQKRTEQTDEQMGHAN